MLRRFTLWGALLLALSLLSGLGISGGIAADDAAFQSKVIASYDFEKDSQGWIPRGSGTLLTQVKDTAQSGSGSLKTTNRTANWHGPSLNVKDIIKKGAVYQISGYVKLAAAPTTPSQVKFTMENKPAGGTTGWTTVAQQSIVDDKWTKLTGTFTFAQDMDALLLYAESSNPNEDIYLDNVVITMTAPPPVAPPVASSSTQADILAFDFEKDTQGWIPRGSGVQVTQVKDTAQSGSGSLKTTNRTANWHGPSLNVKSIIKKGAVYQISGYVKLAVAPSAPSTVKFSMEQKLAGGTTGWKTITQQTIGDDKWTKLAGEYTFTQDMDALLLYVESSNPNEEFYLDNVSITMTGAPASESTIQNDLPSLKEVFADCFKIGAAIEPDQLTGPTAELLKKHYNSIVAENVMKPASIQPVEGTFNWAPADRIFQFAATNKMEVRFHTLVWHSQVGEWFFRDTEGKDMTLETDSAKKEANKKLLLKRLETHISAIAERYKDQVTSWDVVNEVIDPSQPDGMRNSKWYQISGTDYIETAFRTIRKVAGPKAKLYINDYGTDDPGKCEILYKFVKGMLAKGVPIDGVGHQTHINIETPSVAAISKSIQRFAELGLDNQITELDVSVYSNNSTAYAKVPQDLIVQQGYRYRELFAELRKLKDVISNVTFWGVADDHSWLHNRPITRQDAPFAFDEQFQAKPAFWGMVDPSKLPVLAQKLTCYQGTPVIDGADELRWKALDWNPLKKGSGPKASFKTCWDDKHLYLLVEVEDGTKNAGDVVDIFLGGNSKYTLQRSGKAAKDAIFKVKDSQNGYLLEASLSLAGRLGQQIGFDIRVTDAAGNGKALQSSWNDFSMSQDKDTSKYGTLILAEELKVATAVQGTPEIDATIDSIWSKAKVFTTSTKSQDAATSAATMKGATAKVRTLWDENYIYVLLEVSDPVLNKASANAYEQDSIEVFLDENNGKTSVYEADDAQYRVNYENQQSFGSNGADSQFKSAAKVVEGGYIVEVAIPFRRLMGREGMIIGFDAQVNDADQNGKRQSVMTWNDPLGNNYRDTSRYGCLALVLK